MKKMLLPLLVLVIIGLSSEAQVNNRNIPPTRSKVTPSTRRTVSQTDSTDDPNRENIYPSSGFAGIGTLTPGAPLEIKRSAGNTKNKNFLLKLSNEWAANGQNEPSIMFSNGDNTNPKNISYWTIGARVSGDNTLKTPQTFKICFKQPSDAVERDFFSIDSYEGRVRIGEVPTQYDGYKLYVEQGILTEKVKVAVKGSKDWYDNVFEPDYKLMPLTKLGQYIRDNKHLPDVPTTADVMANGIDLGKMNGLLLKKIEELSLYMISLQKELDETKAILKKNNLQ